MYSINRKKQITIRKYLIYPLAEGVILALIALLLTAVTAFFIYHHALKAIKAEIKDGLLRTASGIAACLDKDLIESFDSPEKKNLPEYQAMLKTLQQARIATKHCTYLYVNRLQGEKVVFILDPTPVDEEGKPLFADEKNLAPSIPNTEYSEAGPELLKALKEKVSVVSEEPYTDQWGTFYSAYIPLFNSKKEMIGTLGADLRIDDMLARCEPIEDATKRAFFVSVILAMLFGTLIWFTRRFSLQLNESRYFILDNFIDAKEFADQTAMKIGRQLQRTGMIFANLASRINEVKKEKRSEELQKLLQDEENRLSSLSQALLNAGELKFSSKENDLSEFNLNNLIEELKSGLTQNHKLEANRIKFSIDSNIPPAIFGAARTYDELLAQMASFFIKLFPFDIWCEIIMTQEEPKNFTLFQKMRADLANLDQEKMELLKNLAQEADKEEFFTQLELAEANSISVLRELIYLFNSDICINLTKDNFEISFVCKFQKAPEDDSTEEEN